MMKALKIMRDFRRAEDGAVTVDWVVLTASVVALGTMVVTMLTGNMGSVGAKVNSFMSTRTISTTF
jgi:Flp pilus assembly pilin Flp